MRIAQEGLGDIVLMDIAGNLAQGKSYDLEDSRWLLKQNYNIRGTQDIGEIKGSDIVVITAGLARKPGMTREELLKKNSQILKDICLNIKKLAPESIVIVVTNPLDLMTHYALKITGFAPQKLFGMGISLDTARFANLVAKELNVDNTDVEACVVGSHGEGMLPLERFTSVKGVELKKFLDEAKIKELLDKTVGRGAEIVTLLASGSAFFAPSAAIAAIVKCIVKDEKRTIGVCARLNGEYGIKDICIGVPCRLGKNGIEQIIELDLNREEKEKFTESAASIRQLIQQLTF